MPSTRNSPSKSKTLLIAAAIAISGALIYIAIPKGESPKQAEQNASSFSGIAPKDFHGIPPEGTGGDPDLNRKKNRWVAPIDVTPMTVSQVIGLPHDDLSLMGKESRSKWSEAARAQAAASESRGIQVVGYLAHAKESGAESCNGKNDIYHDFHIWITESPGENKNQGIIVEATPFWKEQFPAWRLSTFEKLASGQAQVRVTGWLLWDQEHGDEVGKSRGSLWEIHPFTKFEYFSGGKWVELASAPL
ncbi:MAG: hypothetical protein Q8916_01600 [Bacteroidota bacterium]|nr:hypothetical protein [Bacteroidota bacterium]